MLSKPPTLIQLGDQAQAQDDWEKAASYYQQVINRNPKVHERIYLELQYAQQQLGNKQAADWAYKRWIENYYLVEHSHKIAYCPIGKNACTLLKNMLLTISPEQENYQQSNLKMHEYIDKNKSLFTLKDFSYLEHSDYFKFIVIRNPFKRLVSTYVDKFVKRRNNKDPHALPVIKSVYEYLGLEPNFAKSITFSQFIDYLLRTEDRHLDGHWRPQAVYFAANLVKFNFVGQFEKLDNVINHLEKQLKLKIDANVSKHRLDYGDFTGKEKFNNIYPEQLSKLAATPKSKQFYTPQLEEKVRIRYAEDIAIYEKEFYKLD